MEGKEGGWCLCLVLAVVHNSRNEPISSGKITKGEALKRYSACPAAKFTY